MRSLSWKDVPEERVNEKTTRKIFWGERVMLARFELAPNAVLPLHEHVSEQVTTCVQGSITLEFPCEGDVTLGPGDMLLIPSSKPHAARVGPDGAVAVDVFSPIRTDFIQAATSRPKSDEQDLEQTPSTSEQLPDAHVQLHRFLRSAGMEIPLEELKDVPLPILARFAYERQCLTMAQLRAILGLDKDQAKALLREWKHGDDHSEASSRRKLERMIVMPSGLPPFRSKTEPSDSSS